MAGLMGVPKQTWHNWRSGVVRMPADAAVVLKRRCSTPLGYNAKTALVGVIRQALN